MKYKVSTYAKLHGVTTRTIWNCKNKVDKFESTFANFMLTFPTSELRDTFYENFKKLIEQCKELL